MLDLVVLIAMAVTAVALAAGLIVQAGIPQITAIIAAAALYLVMAASYIVVARPSHAGDTDRLDQLEGALEVIDSDLQRIDRVENDIARLGQAFRDVPGGHARIEELAAELETVHARIEGLRADLEVETRSQREKISSDLGTLESLIKQLSRDLTVPGAAVAATSSVQPKASTPEPEGEEEEFALASSGEDLTLDEEFETVIAAVADILDGGEGAEIVESETVLTVTETIETVAVAEEDIADAAADRAVEEGMLGTLHQAIEAGRVDLYLQPIVTLPARRVRYYEGVTRIRDGDDELILPGAYLPEAESAGIMPLVDNVLLVKSVQVLRRRGSQSKVKGLFSNISMASLLDPDYFPELVEFMEENSGLSESLIFELRQPEIMGLTRSELDSLDTLGALGFNFSLNHVVDLDIDYIGLSDRYFRFIKLDAPTFLDGMEEKGAPLPPADMVRYLEGFGLQLIVEKVEDEAVVARLVDAGVELAQGNLFAEPKPVTPALFAELEDADAA
ncbi:MAG: EAL domain-containing protein [Methyloceanibacter sp.]|uniref:EAL domain-containing protein n=1 Tax=Methyloceanibacter sp. TaxID=1965321 RepID=UPI003D9B5D13